MNEEKMELEILKLIFDYSKTGHFPDHYFLDKVVEIVVKNKDLNDYVKMDLCQVFRHIFLKDVTSVFKFIPISLLVIGPQPSFIT